MIGFDTNVLVRFLVQDDPVQSKLAAQFMSSLDRDCREFGLSVVKAEQTWPQSRVYKTRRAEMGATVETITRASEFDVEFVQ